MLLSNFSLKKMFTVGWMSKSIQIWVWLPFHW